MADRHLDRELDREVQVSVRRRRASGGGMGVVAIIIALIFIVGPFAVPVKIPALSQIMLVGFGLVLLLIGGIIVTITRLYRKAAADEAFVRTGMGGAKPIVDGGSIVVPVVHEVIPVSLATMKLVVERHGENALITGDNLRADVTAEFYIRVQKNKDDVLAAATSLGERATNPDAVKALLFEKLVNALRTVGATKELFALNTKRDEFGAAVQHIVSVDLKHNGFTLESVTISKLDQTPMRQITQGAAENVFDAQGARRIAEIINAASVERNQIENSAKLKMAEQNAVTAKVVATQEVERETALANQGRDIKKAQAAATSEAATAQAVQLRLSEIALVEKDKAVTIANVTREQEVKVAEAMRDQTVQTAAIERERAVEVTKRDMQITVEGKEADRAKAETLRQTAEADAETARQAVVTVTASADAERKKRIAVIAKEAEAETKKIDQNTTTDIAAYGTTKAAEAEKTAAEDKAAARMSKARAEKDASVLEADGTRATSMVPVDVQKARVAVERQELENKSDFERIASGLTVKLAEIDANKEVQIALAGAMGTALSSTRMTLWGSPEQATQMMEKFLRGQGMASFVSGLFTGTNGDASPLALTAAGLAAAVRKVTGFDIPLDKVSEMLTAARNEEVPTGH